MNYFRLNIKFVGFKKDRDDIQDFFKEIMAASNER